jgi:hypothetical protein
LRRIVNIEPIDGAAIRAGNQVPVRVDGDLDAPVSELLLHIDDALPLLPQQRRERVATEVDAAFARITLGFSLLEDMVAGMVQVLLCAGEFTVAMIVTAEMSFRQRVEVLGSLARHRLESRSDEATASDALTARKFSMWSDDICKNLILDAAAEPQLSYHIGHLVSTKAVTRGFRPVALSARQQTVTRSFRGFRRRTKRNATKLSRLTVDLPA